MGFGSFSRIGFGFLEAKPVCNMFVGMPQLDTRSLQILGFAAKTANVSVSVPSEQKMIENLNIGQKGNGRIFRKWQNEIGGVAGPSSIDGTLVENRNPVLMGDVGFSGDRKSDKSGESRFGSERRNSGVKGETRRVAKQVAYGGCIPSMLRALKTIKDLDEALKPWEETLSNKERSIILKEQTNWERALEIFEWFNRKGCYELNVIHYNILFRILGKARRWDQVESLWGEMVSKRIAPENYTYNTLIDVYSKAGFTEGALLWLGKMYKQGLQPDEVTVGIVIQTYKAAGQVGKAEQFFKTWSSGNFGGEKHHSLYPYNALIDTYGKTGQFKEASETFDRMLSEGIVPNTVTFNTMIHICGNHGRMEEVASLMTKMEDLHCSPDTRTYNILISLHAKDNNIDEAASYFRKMKAAGLEPDMVSYRTLLYAFSLRHMVREAEAMLIEMDKRGLEVDEHTQSAMTRMYVDVGMLEQSWSWFERFHIKGEMSSECYSANIDAFGERGHLLEAEKVFLYCQELMKLTVMEFNVMIKAYGVGKEYNKACELFNDMENYGISPDRCTYNTLIQILSTADLPHRATAYVREMQEAGLVDDCAPYSAVISSFAKLGELPMAEDLFKEMVFNGVQPDIVVFGILVNAFAEVGSLREAMDYVKAMNCAGFAGNSVIYNSLMKLYTKVGYLQEAEETYKLLQISDDGANVYSSNCMIDLYSERTMVGHAEEIFESLKQRGEANEFSFAMMLCMYKKIGQFDQASRIAIEMNELGLLTDVLSFSNVIGLYALDGKLKEAVATFRQMIDSSVLPDDSTFRSLGVVLIKCGVSKEAVCKLELARREDTQCGLNAWMRALSSVVGRMML